MNSLLKSDRILARLLELHPKKIDLALDRVLRLLHDLDDPHLKLPPVIHVAGTNGKGSTVAYLRAILEAAGLRVQSNVPVPGAVETARLDVVGHSLIDLGDDEYTRGRPHPMIDPELRNDLLAKTLADPAVAVVLLDVVIGYGAHPDPAGLIAQVVESAAKARPGCLPVVIASITGTDADPQGYSRQAARLAASGVLVAASNARAASLAAGVVLGSAPMVS